MYTQCTFWFMEQLCTWISDNKVSHLALALRVGVSRVQITRIANGVSRPSFELATKLAAITGIELTAFMEMPRRAATPRKRAA